MRRGTIVAGITAGVLGIGVSSAAASTLPITLDFTTGTVKVGSLAVATQTGASKLTGTIESDTLVATFPATGVTFATAKAGTLSVTPKATGTITGRPNATTGSLDLSGQISYAIAGDAGSCTLAPAAAITLTGAPLDFGTGAYGASGSVMNVSLGCPAYALSAGPLTSTALSYSGKLTIPGVVPPPTSVTVVTPPATTPTTPTTPAAPTTPAVQPGRLAVTVSRPKTVKRGASTVTKVVVTNTGAGTARKVTLKVSAAGKGVTPRATSKTYATIGAGKSRTLNLRLRSTRTAAKSSAVKVTVKGSGGLSASRSTTLKLR